MKPPPAASPSAPNMDSTAPNTRSATCGQLAVPQPDSGPPGLLPTRSLPNTTAPGSPSAARSPVTIPPPSSMPLPPPTPPGSIVTHARASPAHGHAYGVKPAGPYYPYTQPQPQQPQHSHQQSYQPSGAQTMTRQQTAATAESSSSSPSSLMLQRANSAPPARGHSIRRSVGLSSSDWHPPAAATAAGTAADAGQSSDPGADPTGSIIKPYGFLPPPVTAPPLKPSWPTSRLVSSRRSAASAFTSFSAAPTAALRITGIGHAAALGGARPATATSPPPARPPSNGTKAAAATAPLPPPPQKRFSSSRTRSLADNLTFLYRGNTYNPPLNERISRLFDTVLPPPSPATQMLLAIPSVMAPPPPPSPPPPEATAQFDRALQQRREAVVAQRSLMEGGGTAAAAEAAAVMDRWGSRRGVVRGPAFRSLSLNSPWLGRAGEWGDVGGGSVLHRGGSPEPGGVRSDGALDTGGGDGAWGGGYKKAATAAAMAAAVQHVSGEVLHLQGVSYKAAKAATRALSDMQRPGISLRVQAHVEDDYSQLYAQHPQPHTQHLHQQHPQLHAQLHLQHLQQQQQQRPQSHLQQHASPRPPPYPSPHPPQHPPQHAPHAPQQHLPQQHPQQQPQGQATLQLQQGQPPYETHPIVWL